MNATTQEQCNSVPHIEAMESPHNDPAEIATRSPVILRAGHRDFPPLPSLRREPIQAAAWLVKACSALIFLTALLATAASTPLLNFFALGYLMETQGQVARTGKFRSAFHLLPAALRLGGILLASWLWLLPIQFLAGAARDSWLLAPGTTVAWMWTCLLTGGSVVIATHLLFAIGCGGGWWRFVRPISNVRWLLPRLGTVAYWRDAHQAISEFVAAFQLPRLLGFGIAAYVAVTIWLFIPTLLFTSLNDVNSRWEIVAFTVGGLALTLILPWMPLLLTHLATERRWRAVFDVATVRKLACRTPFCWAISTSFLFACSVVPLLYTALVKIQIPPHDARWDLMLVFLVMVAPARVLVGWVYHRATRKIPGTPTWFWRIWQWVNGVALTIAVGYYVYFLYLAETGGELGQRVVWQHHALLLPLPF